MNYKLQLSPQSSTHDGLPLSDWRNTLPANWEEASFFGSWLVYDFKVRPGLELPRIDWHNVLGLTLALAVSGGIWGGIGLLIAYIWK